MPSCPSPEIPIEKIEQSCASPHSLQQPPPSPSVIICPAQFGPRPTSIPRPCHALSPPPPRSAPLHLPRQPPRAIAARISYAERLRRQRPPPSPNPRRTGPKLNPSARQALAAAKPVYDGPPPPTTIALGAQTRPGRPLGRILSRARLPSSRHRPAPGNPATHKSPAHQSQTRKIPKSQITVQTTLGIRSPQAASPSSAAHSPSPQNPPKSPTVSPPSRRENIHATRTVPVLINPDNPLPSRESRSRQPPPATSQPIP